MTWSLADRQHSRYSRTKLADIAALNFTSGAVTAWRRTAPQSQLECISKSCSRKFVEYVSCSTILGTSKEVIWNCTADLPSNLRFGKMHVSCEGWDYPGDPFVLQGSCGLQYELVTVPSFLLVTGSERSLLFPGCLTAILFTFAFSCGFIFFMLFLNDLAAVNQTPLSDLSQPDNRLFPENMDRPPPDYAEGLGLGPRIPGGFPIDTDVNVLAQRRRSFVACVKKLWRYTRLSKSNRSSRQPLQDERVDWRR